MRSSVSLNRRAVVGVLTWLALVLFVATSVAAETEITLKNTFIEKFKNRATIEVRFTVDKAHAKPNAPSKDGDLHVAGRAPEIRLATVAEIMNARLAREAADEVHRVEGTNEAIKIKGAWRLWTEHSSNVAHVQGKNLAAFSTTNPDHAFEIHPVLELSGRSLSHTFIPIEGYQAKDAHDAFVKYENVPARIRINKSAGTTTIVTSMAGYNYVEFVLEVLEDEQKEVEDGRFVFAAVRDLSGELLVHKRRMVFLKGTPPEELVKTLNKGDQIRVLGVPRIDLALVSWRVRNAGNLAEVLTWSLPYEIIVVGTSGRFTEPE
jgi:hypothetical protein